MNSTLFLMIGYAVGQGGGFALQVYCRQAGYLEQAGLLVLIFSLFSFSLQFSELGGATYISKNYNEKNIENIKKFVSGRALFALLITIIMALYFNKNSDGASQVFPLILMAPLLAFVFGLVPVSIFESTGNYAALALIQAVMWVIITSVGVVMVFLPKVFNYYVFASLIGGCFLYFFYFAIFFRKIESEKYKFLSPPSLKALPFIFGAIGGQFWGRYILVKIENGYGLEVLGSFGFIKYLQVATCIFLSFMMRPIFQNFLRTAKNKKITNAWVLIKFQKKSIYVALFVCVLGLFTGLYNNNYDYNKIIGPWMFISICIPGWVFCSIFSQLNQINFSGGNLIVIEAIGLLVNASLFLIFIDVSPVFAIIFGELGQAFVAIIFYVTFCIIIKNRRRNG